MIEILFRGKRKDNNQWVYGCLVYYIDETIDVPHFIIDKKNNKFEVNPEIIGQYIGANDITGAKVFVGDIMSSDDHNVVFDVVCKADDIISSPYKFRPNHKSGYMPSDFYPNEHKIIGNIHDNPELIK